eukprot:6340632-Amphidinium_carterae.1
MATGVKVLFFEAAANGAPLELSGLEGSGMLAPMCDPECLPTKLLSAKPHKSKGIGGGSLTFSGGFPEADAVDIDMSIILDRDWGKSTLPQCRATLRSMACLLSLAAPGAVQLSVLSPTDDDTLRSARSSEHSVLP